MKITVPFSNNILPDRFAKHADEVDKILDNPVRSFPFEVSELPEGTKYIAVALIDYDSIPVCSFAWIHWLVSDIKVEGDKVVIPENYSLEYKDSIIQGKNSLSSPFLAQDFSEIEVGYIGPTPPDKDHKYTLQVFALSEKLNLKNGFFYNELLDAAAKTTLEKEELVIIGRV